MFSLAPQHYPNPWKQTFSCLRSKGLACCCGMLLLLLLTACGGTAGNGKFVEGIGGVQGRVYSAEGQIASNVDVYVVGQVNTRMTTGTDGRFILKDIPAGKQELILTNHKGLAARIKVWIVRDHITEMAASQTIMLPTGSLSGQVVAPPRLNNKGIPLYISRTRFETTTYSDGGSFRFANLPAGCHQLYVTAPLFDSYTRKTVCIKPGENRVLDLPIQIRPTKACKTHSECPSAALCHEYHCVPEGDGKTKLLTSNISFSNVKPQSTASRSVEILKNVGVGPLLIESIELRGGVEIFSLDEKLLPSLPHKMKIGESLVVRLSFNAEFATEHRATLRIRTNDVENPELEISILGTIKAYDSDCLAFSNKSTKSGGASRQLSVSVDVYNRCGQPVAIGTPRSNQKPPQGSNPPQDAKCADRWGDFSIPTCIAPPSSAAVSVKPYEQRTLSWNLETFGYGPLKGTLEVPYTERRKDGTDKEQSIKIAIEQYIEAKNLEISPRSVHFGTIAPGSRQSAWLGIQFKGPTTLDSLQTSFTNNNSLFKTTQIRWARNSAQSSIHYIELEYNALLQLNTSSSTLVLQGLPALEGLPYHVPVNGAVATPQTPVLKTHLSLGHSEWCQAPEEVVTLMNPGDSPVTVQGISIQSIQKDDFVLKHKGFPFTLPPRSTVELGSIQWIRPPSNQVTKALGALEVEVRQKHISTKLVSQLKGKMGISRTDSYYQPSTSSVNLLLFMDLKSEGNSFITNGLLNLYRKMNQQQIDFTIHNIDEGTTPITSNAINAEQELLRWLQRSTQTSHLGIKKLSDKRKQLLLPDANSTTIALVLSEYLDFSPYTVASYLPQNPQSEPSRNFSVFAAAPRSSCKDMEKALRYLDIVVETGGVVMDLCQPSTSNWQLWFAQVEQLILQQRKRFPLRKLPNVQSIRVRVDGVELEADQPNNQWRYDPSTNQVILTGTQLYPGKKIEITYFTSCQ